MTDNALIAQKTRELCQAIVDQPEFKSIRQRIENFQNNEAAKSQYLQLNTQREQLEEKQQQNLPLAEGEIADFEKQRDEFLENPVAMAFLDAQQEIQQARQDVNKFVMKTYELGRVPGPEDLASCGSGCQCH